MLRRSRVRMLAKSMTISPRHEVVQYDRQAAACHYCNLTITRSHPRHSRRMSVREFHVRGTGMANGPFLCVSANLRHQYISRCQISDSIGDFGTHLLVSTRLSQSKQGYSCVGICRISCQRKRMTLLKSLRPGPTIVALTGRI